MVDPPQRLSPDRWPFAWTIPVRSCGANVIWQAERDAEQLTDDIRQRLDREEDGRA